MKRIPLTKQKFALVDDGDFKWLNQWKWTYHNFGYAYRKNKKKQTYMHRVILNNPKSQVDHINGNPLDNQRKNLRKVTSQQNRMNSATRYNNTSGVKGVVYHKRNKVFQAQLGFTKNGVYKNIYLGSYKTLEEAKKARIKGETKYYKEYRRAN